MSRTCSATRKGRPEISGAGGELGRRGRYDNKSIVGRIFLLLLNVTLGPPFLPFQNPKHVSTCYRCVRSCEVQHPFGYVICSHLTAAATLVVYGAVLCALRVPIRTTATQTQLISFNYSLVLLQGYKLFRATRHILMHKPTCSEPRSRTFVYALGVFVQLVCL